MEKQTKCKKQRTRQCIFAAGRFPCVYLQIHVCVSACLCKMVSASATSETQYWDTNSESERSTHTCLCIYHCLTFLGIEYWGLEEEYSMCMKECNTCVWPVWQCLIRGLCHELTWPSLAPVAGISSPDPIPQLSLSSPTALESPGLAKLNLPSSLSEIPVGRRDSLGALA